MSNRPRPSHASSYTPNHASKRTPNTLVTVGNTGAYQTSNAFWYQLHSYEINYAPSSLLTTPPNTHIHPKHAPKRPPQNTPIHGLIHAPNRREWRRISNKPRLLIPITRLWAIGVLYAAKRNRTTPELRSPVPRRLSCLCRCHLSKCHQVSMCHYALICYMMICKCYLWCVCVCIFQSVTKCQCVV